MSMNDMGGLMSVLIEWAQSNPIITRVELDVLATNRRAISLYLKHGFVVEGCRRQAYFKAGVFVDGYVMGLLLNKKADG
jgi:RimJ/RimL family protein N-acetyltransferase